MDKSTKIIALMAAFVMLAVPTSVVFGTADDVEATGTVGDMDFYYTTDLTTYVKYDACGFNASDALSSQTTLLSAMGASVDNNYSKQYVNEWGSYTSINDEWGKITKSIPVEGSVWNVFVYTNDGLNGAGQWKIADKTLGFYKAFDDYSAGYATANVALYYGPLQTAVPANLPSVTQTLTSVTQTPTFAVSFEMLYNDVNNNAQYITVTGYGSDAALALINAVGSDVSLVTVPGLNYGYLNSMYGLATSDTSGTWQWWHMENNTIPGTAYSESQFYLGFYTPLTGFALSSNMIALTYY